MFFYIAHVITINQFDYISGINHGVSYIHSISIIVVHLVITGTNTCGKLTVGSLFEHGSLCYFSESM